MVSMDIADVPMDIDYQGYVLMNEGWVYDVNGNPCYNYEVNGIACTMWQYDEGFFPWKYGDNMYWVNDIYAFDQNFNYIGYMTEEGDLHVYQPIG